MKRLMLGNQAVARGLYEAGVTVVSSYPGTPSTEITENAAAYDEIYCEWAPNEKAAAETALGASIAGARAACAMKHVGLNVAADPMFTAAYTGVNGGLVCIVADDPGMHSSQNEQDTRLLARAAHLPVLEPASSQECLDFTILAFALSEKYDTPVILRLTTRIAHSQGLVETGERVPYALKAYKKDYEKYVMMPGPARKRQAVLQSREANMAKDAACLSINAENMRSAKLGVITSGISYQYVMEALPDASVLKLGLVYPLPGDLIRDFASKVDRLVVAEELEPFLEHAVAALGIKCEGENLFTKRGELSAALIAHKLSGRELVQPVVEEIMRPPVLCPGCPHRGVYYLLNKLRYTAMGDIGCYTLGALPPLLGLDTCICMGASIGAAHGFEKARGQAAARNTVAVIGDSTFMHSGITGLVNMVYNGSSGTVLILDNATTGMTGHQQNPATGKNIKGEPAYRIDLESLCKAVGVPNVRVEDPFDLQGLERALKEETAKETLSVIIARRPCALVCKSKAAPCAVAEHACRACKACLKLGCPAIENRGKAYINPALCSGCGLCGKVCAFNAIGCAAKVGE